MKSCLYLFCIALLFTFVRARPELFTYYPIADPSAVVISGNARFTVLTPRLIRMEYSSTGIFEDRATIAFVNRRLRVPPFSQNMNSNVLTIKTSSLSLSYDISKPFSSSSLSVTSLASNSHFGTWRYGQDNPRNLLGTIKSLDMLNVITLNCTQIQMQNITVHDESLHCEWGLISRDGWSVVDDSKNYGLDAKTFWWETENTDDIDIYFFGHERDYKGALADFVQVGGRIPLVPRYALGVWWSRWYNLNNYDVLEIVDTYQSQSIPLDVFILDMDWHTKQRWGGYSIDRRLFPTSASIFASLNMLYDLPVGANLHDDDGVNPWEDKYNDMATALGIDPRKQTPIPFMVVNQSYMNALEDIVLRYVEDQGMAFWWIDWQQGGKQGGCTGEKQNPTIGLSKVRCTDSFRRLVNDRRDFVLARWGGLGNHRYQVGFSGDVLEVSWQNLAFQPYFSLTSSNVAYGYWSHDIVGPPNQDHELHTRWIQWGAYSGIMRTHDRGMAVGTCADSPTGCPIIEIWRNPFEYFKIMRAAMKSRVELTPYMYNALREAFETGVSILRPMYYEFPDLDMAYMADDTGNFAQYFFGGDMFVAPVVTPALPNVSMAVSTIWIPPGTWVEKESGRVIVGGETTTLTKSHHLSEIPVFVRSGAIIPGIPVRNGDTIGLARRPYTTLVLTIYPGAASGNLSLYEDDARSLAYLDNLYTRVSISYQRTSTQFDLTISPRTGYFPEGLVNRQYIIKIVNGMPITFASVNGAPIHFSRIELKNTWRYDGLSFTTIISTDAFPTASTVKISATTMPSNNFGAELSGFSGAIKRSILSKQVFDETNDTPGSFTTTGGYLDQIASTEEELSSTAAAPSQFSACLSNLPSLFQFAVQEIQNIQPTVFNISDNSPQINAPSKTRWAYGYELLRTALL